MVVTHGNGPQVGFILLRSEIVTEDARSRGSSSTWRSPTRRAARLHRRPTRCVNELGDSAYRDRVVCVLTQTVVDRRRSGLRPPDQADRPVLSPRRKPDDQTACTAGRWSRTAGRGYRRVVASPRPRRGSWRVPDHPGPGRGRLRGDRGRREAASRWSSPRPAVTAGSRPCRQGFRLGASRGEPRRCRCWCSRPASRRWRSFPPAGRAVRLDRIVVSDARRLPRAAGEFPKGRMGPKIEAAIGFLERGGQEVIITTRRHSHDAIAGDTGTRVVREPERGRDPSAEGGSTHGLRQRRAVRLRARPEDHRARDDRLPARFRRPRRLRRSAGQRRLVAAAAPCRRPSECSRPPGRGHLVIHTREGHRPDLADLPPRQEGAGRLEGPASAIPARWAASSCAASTATTSSRSGSRCRASRSSTSRARAPSTRPTCRRSSRTAASTSSVVCGVTTEVCVNTTVREANDRGYDCLVLVGLRRPRTSRSSSGGPRDDRRPRAGSSAGCPTPGDSSPRSTRPRDQPGSGGQRSRHGAAASNAAEARSTSASSRCRPTICSPTGRPSTVHPAGTDAAGWPVMFIG